MDITLQNDETVNSETPMTYLIPVQYSILFTNRPLQKNNCSSFNIFDGKT